jgi:predicted PurR-regulated permease PerM
MTSKIEISHRTIIFILSCLALIWLVWEIKDILFLLFISYIIMSAVRPFVDRLQQRRVPRILSILMIYIVMLVVIGLSLSTMIPVIVSQTNKFFLQLPRYIEVLSPYYKIDTSAIYSQIAPIGQNIIKFTIDIFSNIVTMMTVLVFTFYLLLEYNRIQRYIRTLLDRNNGDRVVEVMTVVEMNLGSWLRGQLFLMFCVGLLTFIGLTFLRVEYALPLAILAGILEIIPVIGPILSAIPAILLALPVPFLSIAMVALYFLIQQLENNVIVPLVMNRAVGLSPLIVIVALMVGSRLGGPVGAVLAIPIVVMIRAVMVTLLGKSLPDRSSYVETS